MAEVSKDFLIFLKELANNNNREWFTENKKRYQDSVQNPFEELVNQLKEELKGLMPGIKDMGPKDFIFRIHRDVRFSKDKSPYKTHVSALISEGGKKDKIRPGLYLQISAEDVRLYSGSHMLEKDQLKSVRNKIVKESDRFKKLISDKSFTSVFGEILGEKNKRLDPVHAEIESEIPLIANKSFYYFRKLPPKSILDASFPKEVLETMKAAQPLNTFLSEAIK